MSEPTRPVGAHDPVLAADHDPLVRFIRGRGLLTGRVDVARIGDGHSNLSYLVSERDGDGRVVVRRPPPGRGAVYDVLREAGTIAAVGRGGFPVPGVLATAKAGDVLDVSLFVMEFVPGPIITTSVPEALATGPSRAAAAMSLVDTLASLHALDWRGIGMRGRPEGANRRQRSRIARLVADDAGDPPEAFRAVDAWLERHTPAESAESVVHNDYRFGNVVLDPRTVTVRTVLDWELAAVGDPMVDLGYLLATWAERDRPLTPIEELGSATAAPGFPTKRALAERYAASRGVSLANLEWYVALAYWKLAVLYEYNRRLTIRGDGDQYYAGSAKVEALLVAAERATSGF